MNYIVFVKNKKNMEEYIAALGHKLNQFDKVEWITSGFVMIGKIIGFDNGKVKIETLGCRHKNDEELETIKKKAKRFYSVDSRRLFLLA